ncbi:MAG: tyrosine-type recombinase/integrase [Bdellovibrionales bacterium]|nr:tyrosine-type recombinase/integrase [Bdellovibrionales bacterium]
MANHLGIPSKSPLNSAKSPTNSRADNKALDLSSSKNISLNYKTVFSKLSSHEQGLLFSWLYQKAPNTRRYYQRIWTEFLSLFEVTVNSFREIQIGHLVLFLKSKEHLKPASRNLAKNSLSSFLSFLTKTGFLEKNPGLSLESIKVPDRVGTKILSHTQVLRMYECERSLRNRAIIKLLYFSGIRVGELVGLKLSDVRIKPSGESLLQILGKGGVVRNVIVPKALMDEIYSYHKEIGLKKDPKTPLFLSKKAPYGRLSPEQVFRMIKNAAKKAKVSPVPSPHWFRHTSATHALENGAPIHVVQKTLGHRSVATTGRYLEANPKESNSKWLEWDD